MQGMHQRQSMYSVLSGKNGAGSSHERLMSMGGMSDHMNHNNPYANHRPSMGFTQSPDHFAGSQNFHHSYTGSTSNLLGATPTNHSNPRLRSPLGGAIGGSSRPVSTVNFMDGPKTGPADQDIQMAIRECLREVDLDNVTKKQLRALAEQRLQTQLVGERKAYLDQMIDIELADM
jgi:chitin synthase